MNLLRFSPLWWTKIFTMQNTLMGMRPVDTLHIRLLWVVSVEIMKTY